MEIYIYIESDMYWQKLANGKFRRMVPLRVYPWPLAVKKPEVLSSFLNSDKGENDTNRVPGKKSLERGGVPGNKKFPI